MSAADLTLDRATTGQVLLVRSLVPHSVLERVQRLAEIGFIEGERVQLLRRGPMGGEPLMVRVGMSVFALRREEAACVHVAPPAAA